MLCCVLGDGTVTRVLSTEVVKTINVNSSAAQLSFLTIDALNSFSSVLSHCKIIYTDSVIHIMSFKTVLFSSLAATAMAGTAGDRPLLFGCGTGRPHDGLISASMDMRVAEAGLTSRGEVARAEISVNTYVHVVARDTTEKGGYISVRNIAQSRHH